MAGHNHPVFTRVYSLIAKLEDHGSVGDARTRAAADLNGKVLIVGLGPGQDLHHLPSDVVEVVALEPSKSMRREAEQAVLKARQGGLYVEVIDGVAEAIPLPDDSVDGVLLAFVLCTIEGNRQALAEVRRVLRPNGKLAILEHVQGKPGTLSYWSQRVASPFWPRLGGGCHCDRNTRELLEQEGFDTADLTDEVLVNPPPVAPTIVGTARLHASRS
jgi:ubiquinone/menaquinone biosynthesis C-methylase UbiE